MPAMSNVASTCPEFGIAVVPPARRRKGGAAPETCAASTLRRLLPDWGKSHLRYVFSRLLTAQVTIGR